MTVLLQLQNAHKRYGLQHLLDDASCAVNSDEKVGMVGRNGAGKSTLCRLLLGEEELDAGKIVRSKRLRLGYLRQHNPFLDDETVIGFLCRDSGRPDWRCGELAWRFQIPDTWLDHPVAELSGGWQTRVKLAALLLHEPNLLLLDEPTNFLDLRTQLLLEQFLRDFRGACLIVSHDRSFLKATCSHTLELSRGKLTKYPGDIDAYLTHLDERQKHDRRVNETTLAKRKQLESFIAKNRANANTASQARSKAKQLSRLELVAIAAEESRVRFSFPNVPAGRGTALRTEELAIGYPGNVVAADVHLDIEHGKRVGVVGDNGQGKTTFLRTICGSLPVQAGSFSWGFGCQIGVYAQHVYTTLPEEQTAQEYLEYQAAAGTTNQQIKDVAGSFLFGGDAIDKRIEVLSGGERARLVLGGLLLQQHNVLVLDEPGNHLDVETVEALAEALVRYQGTVVFTSHDRHFMSRVATAIIEVGQQRVTSYPASFDDYAYRVGREIVAGLRDAAASGHRADRGAAPAVERNRGKENREAEKRLRSIERKIQRLDEEKRAIQNLLMSTTDVQAASDAHQQLTAIASDLEQLESEWFALQDESQH